MAKKKKTARIHSDIKNLLSPETIETINVDKLEITKSSNEDQKTRYSKEKKIQKLTFVAGFDLMQYNIVIRPYIIQKYHLKNELELDVLLYLYPINFFSRPDFKLMPTDNLGYSLKKLIEDGLIILLVRHKEGYAKNIYGLSDRAKAAVKSYYMFLSGERTLGDNSYTKPFYFQENTKINRERRELMLKLKHKSQSRPSLFTRGSF